MISTARHALYVVALSCALLSHPAQADSSRNVTTTGPTASQHQTRSTTKSFAANATSTGNPDVAQSADVAKPIDTALVPDLFTGTMGATITLRVPAGRGLVQPSLKLAYRSANPNGWLGMGWDIDVGAIERSTRFGVAFDCQDNQVSRPCFNFSIDGTKQPLVKIPSGQFRFKTDDFSQRIRKLSNAAGLTYWELTDKRGTRYTFGSGLESQQEDQGRIYKWGLDRVEDANGNFMVIEYAKQAGQLYLDRIEYTGNGGITPKNRVNFVLEPRNDFSDTFTFGFRVSTQRRLKSIEVYSLNSLERRYELGYGSSVASLGRSLLTSVTLHATDSGQTLPPVRIAYHEPTFSWAPTPLPWGKGPSVNKGIRDQCMTGDFNGDGKLDIACYSGKQALGWSVALSTSKGWDTQTWPAGTTAGPHVRFPVGWQCIPGDFNGDGKTDLACYTQQAGIWHVALSNGATWRGSHWDHGPAAGPHVGYTCVAGDFNGDGKTDLACWTGGRHWHVALSTGSGWSSSGADWDDGPVGSVVVSTGCFVGDFNGDGLADLACPSPAGPGLWDLALSGGSSWKRIVRPGPLTVGCSLGDFNGDGISDLACHDKTSGWSVWLGTGDGWEMHSWGADPDPTHLGGGSCLFSDFNGDGRTDIACKVIEYVNAAPSRVYWRLGLSTGRSFEPTDWNMPSGFYYADPNKCFDGDFTGTGRTAIVCQEPQQGIWDAIASEGAAPDLLRRITDSDGSEVQVTYQSTASVHPTPHSGLPFPVNVVSSTSTSDGRGTSLTKSFSYEGGLYDSLSRDFRGFAQVTVVEPTQASSDQVRVAYSFHQGTEPPDANNDYTGLVGKVARIKTLDQGGHLLLDQTFTYRDNGGKVPFFNPPKQIDNYICDGQSCAKHAVLRLDYEPDYGNVVREERIADVMDRTQDVVIERTFWHDEDHWIVGLPTSETVWHTVVGTNEMAAAVQYGYDQYSDCGSAQRSSGPVHGNLTSVRRWSAGPQTPEWQMSYDSFGNRTCERDPRGGVFRVAFDYSLHSLPVSFTNPLNQTPITLTYYGVDGAASRSGSIGQLSTVSDANNSVSTFEYDAFGRLLTLTDADGGRRSWSYLDVGNPNKQNIRVVDQNGLTTSMYFDGLHRVWRTKSTGPDGHNVARDTRYSARGTVNAISFPYFEGQERRLWTRFTYDALSRMVRTDRPDGTFLTRCYTDRQSATVDENGHLRIALQDGYGRVSRVEVYPGKFIDCEHLQTLPPAYSVASYTYNAFGLPSSIVDPNDNETRLSYDGRGLLVKRVDPESGTWTYTYDENGNLASRTDAEGRVMYLHYDALNRVVQKEYRKKRRLGKGDFVLTYDTADSGIGKLSAIHSHRGETRFTYDKLGRVTQKKRVDAFRTTSTSITYDSGGRLTSLRYPTGRIATYGYNGPLVSGVRLDDGREIRKEDFDALGRARTVTLPNGMTEQYTFDRKENPACLRDDLRLCSIELTDSGGRTWRGLRYAYDYKGNVQTVEEDDAQQFMATYDDYDRLISVSALHPVRGYPLRFEYDPLGNIKFNSRVGNYRYGLAGVHPYAMTDAGNYHLEYDRNGNVSRDEYRALTYDAEGRPTKIVLRRRFGGWLSFLFPKTVTSTFEYGFSGERERMKETRTLPYPLNWLWPRKTTVFMNRISECTGRRCDDYVLVNGPPVAAMRRDKKHVAFIFSDNLGSSRLVDDRQDNSLVHMEYFPFGELLEKSGNDADDVTQRFAGASFDESTRLYFFDFRYYDPVLGRYISPDPDKEAIQTPDRSNGYSYVADNPLTLVDPLGLTEADPNSVGPETPTEMKFHEAQMLPVTFIEESAIKTQTATENTTEETGPGVDVDIKFSRFSTSAGEQSGTHVIAVNYYGDYWGHIGISFDRGPSLGFYPGGSIPFLPSVGAPFFTQGGFASDAAMQNSEPTNSIAFQVSAAQVTAADRAIRDIQVDASNFNALTNNCTIAAESVLRAAGIPNVPTTIFPAVLMQQLPRVSSTPAQRVNPPMTPSPSRY
jgi:RHS repeat-associated protein